MLDGIDKQILSFLLNDAATSKAEIARRVGLAASAVSERVRRLESDNVIAGYEVRLDAKALGKPLLAFVFVTDVKPSRGFDTAAALSQVTGLEELHKVAGDDCYLLKIRASGTDELNQIIETQINPVQSVTRVRTTIVLNAVTERPPLSGHKDHFL
ncbi:MAG: Lrp/AsnC family transcriptional regulator [Pseudomonadota bacterium]